MAASAPRIRIAAKAASAVRRGHPWVYRDAIAGRPPSLPSGAVVDLCDEADRFTGRGLWDATGPIAARVLVRRSAEAVDEEAFATRFERALRLRDRLFAQTAETNAYRLCNGEGDRLPGLVVDRYADVAIVRLDGAALDPWLDRIVPRFAPLLARRGVRSIALRLERGAAGDRRIRVLSGPDPPDRLVVREHGMAMEVDLARGQKTGAFLDQRENRARVRVFAAGRTRALNLFSYAGGFSIAAALGGARHVTSVDAAAAAHASAQRSFRENGLDPSEHAFVTADAFAWLDQAAERGERFDLVVSDPPSFAPSERARPGALRAYRRLHAAIARVLDEGAIFCAASCSSHVTMDDFVATLDDATLGDRGFRLVALHGQPPDHPTLAAWPEGRYLKMAVLAE